MGGDNGELLFNRYRASVLQMKRVTGMDGSDGYKTMRMYLMPLNYIHLKMVKMVIVVCILPQYKKIYFNK